MPVLLRVMPRVTPCRRSNIDCHGCCTRLRAIGAVKNSVRGVLCHHEKGPTITHEQFSEIQRQGRGGRRSERSTASRVHHGGHVVSTTGSIVRARAREPAQLPSGSRSPPKTAASSGRLVAEKEPLTTEAAWCDRARAEASGHDFGVLSMGR